MAKRKNQYPLGSPGSPPARLKIAGRWYRGVPLQEYAQLRRRWVRAMNEGGERAQANTWAKMEHIDILDPETGKLMGLSVTPYCWRYFVARWPRRKALPQRDAKRKAVRRGK